MITNFKKNMFYLKRWLFYLSIYTKYNKFDKKIKSAIILRDKIIDFYIISRYKGSNGFFPTS